MTLASELECEDKDTIPNTSRGFLPSHGARQGSNNGPSHFRQPRFDNHLGRCNCFKSLVDLYIGRADICKEPVPSAHFRPLETLIRIWWNKSALDQVP
mgnify:CR=1 FL=1